MKHIPYGYKIVNGEIRIDIESTKRVVKLYELYLEENSLIRAGELAGIKKYHGSIRSILSNRKYLGTPSIISMSVFEKVQTKRKEKAKKLGKDNYKEKVVVKVIPINSNYLKSIKEFDDPFEEEEHRCNQIIVEVL